jgi:hypothetical protein
MAANCQELFGNRMSHSHALGKIVLSRKTRMSARGEASHLTLSNEMDMFLSHQNGPFMARGSQQGFLRCQGPDR